VFCGRKREVRVIEDHCRAGRFVVITAEPGMGLTTLLEEGLSASWRAEGCITLVHRDWQGRGFATDLRGALAAAVREQADDSFFAQPETLAEAIERVRYRTGRPLAILLDQFEDYLRCHTGTDISDSFDAELSHAIADRQCQFVIGLQEHAVESFRRFSQYIPNLLGSRVTLGAMDSDEARELVERIAEVDKVRFERAVVDALVRAPAARAGDGVHPYFVAAGVRRLIETAAEKKVQVVGESMVAVHGGADRLILESLDAKLSELNSTQTELFFRWCNVLISDTGQRLAVTSEWLMQYAGKLNRFGMALLPILIEEGILRTIELQGQIRYEIARECDAALIRDWWKRREAALVARQKAQFRVRSISVAVGSIVAMYVIWLVLSVRK
jgi:hypothetical protein